MRSEMNVHQLDCKLSLHDIPFFSGCLNSIPSFTLIVEYFCHTRADMLSNFGAEEQGILRSLRCITTDLCAGPQRVFLIIQSSQAALGFQ
jgi:hypothetical protein